MRRFRVALMLCTSALAISTFILAFLFDRAPVEAKSAVAMDPAPLYGTRDSGAGWRDAAVATESMYERARVCDSTAQIRGLAVGLHAGHDDYDYAPALKEIAATGANAVELVIAWYQADVRSSHPRVVKGRTPSAARIAATIESAHRLGLRVHLLPIVLMEKASAKEWRGAMKPGDPGLWWKNYRGLVRDLARIAEDHGAESLSVGSELLWSERERTRWEEVILEARIAYHGQILYSANWDHYRVVSFWDLLDQVGISGYFELTRDSDASREILAASWRDVREDILAWLPESKPLLFTEIGCPAVDGGAVYPWNYTMKTKRDDAEQARALGAFVDAWKNTPQLAGAFIYEWELPGLHATNYSPRGREGEAIVRNWFRE